MPNHVTSILRFSGDVQQIESLRKNIENPEYPGSIDFEKILPIRSNIYMGNLGPRERALYGANNWYDWCIGNWGTKWNAYDFPDSPPEDGSLRFQSAWSAPHPVIKRLSEMYPDITIHHEWADEDIGSNCGEKTYKGGQILDEYYPDYGRRSKDFALKVLDSSPEEYDWVLNSDGTDYEYRPEPTEMEEMNL